MRAQVYVPAHLGTENHTMCGVDILDIRYVCHILSVKSQGPPLIRSPDTGAKIHKDIRVEAKQTADDCRHELVG
jgi:hypothetical protein